MSEKVLRKYQASMDDLYPMLEFILSFAAVLSEDKEKLGHVRLIAEEALVNIINYSYKNAPGAIGIECERFSHTLKITIVDDGIPFDPIQEARRFNLKEHERLENPGGYGTYLMLSLADDLTYRREESSNILVITKEL